MADNGQMPMNVLVEELPRLAAEWAADHLAERQAFMDTYVALEKIHAMATQYMTVLWQLMTAEERQKVERRGA